MFKCIQPNHCQLPCFPLNCLLWVPCSALSLLWRGWEQNWAMAAYFPVVFWRKRICDMGIPVCYLLAWAEGKWRHLTAPKCLWSGCQSHTERADVMEGRKSVWRTRRQTPISLTRVFIKRLLWRYCYYPSVNWANSEKNQAKVRMSLVFRAFTLYDCSHPLRSI